MLLRLGLTLALCLGMLAPAARAAEFTPNRPVRFVVPFAAGGSADVLARIAGQALGEMWNQQVVIDNRPGVGGHLGAELVARSPGDGHSLVLGTIGIHAAYGVYRSLGYDPAKDLAPVAVLAEFPNVVVVHPSVPARTLPEFIALAKQRPGQLVFGSAGNATSTHLAGELFMLVSGVRLTHAPYRGSSQAMNDLVAGNIQAMFENLPTVPPQSSTGRIRPLAVTSAQRSPSLPDVPTAEEAGLPGYVATAWFTVAAPGSTPAPLLEALNADLRAALAQPAMRDRYIALGATPGGGTVSEARRFFAAETEKWNRVIAAANLRVD